jgi:hypothetical protein
MMRLSFDQPRRSEAQVTQYVLREHHRGRPLRDLFSDRYVRNRCSNEQLHRVLDDPEVVHAIGEDDIGAVRRQLPM